MINFVLIACCILAGVILKRTRSVHPEAHKGINAWVINIALPAVSFAYLPYMDFSPEMLFPVAATFIVIFIAAIVVKIYSRKHRLSERTRRTIELASAYGNTSFLGFPLVIAFFGAENLGIAVLCDQALFLALSTLGMISAFKGGKGRGSKMSPRLILKRLLSFPPFVACALALTLGRAVPIDFTRPLFDLLASTVAPLALFSIGLQLQFKGLKNFIPGVSISLLFKLVIAPAITFALALLIGLKGIIPRVTVFELAMSTSISAGIIAEQFGLNTKLINLIIGSGIILGFGSSALWFLIVDSFL